MSKTRIRPTAEDQRIATYFRLLPPGKHIVVVEGSGSLPALKCEGGLIYERPDGKRLVVYPG